MLKEPENHLLHTRLNQLIKCISEQYLEKQMLVSTHSSFVANKLGLGKVISVGVSFLRFPEFADCIQTKLAVVTDIDGNMASISKNMKNI